MIFEIQHGTSGGTLRPFIPPWARDLKPAVVEDTIVIIVKMLVSTYQPKPKLGQFNTQSVQPHKVTSEKIRFPYSSICFKNN